MSVASWAHQGINKALRPLGVQLVRLRRIDVATEPEPQVAAAVVQAMLQLGALGNEIERVCEIGARSGRYAEKVIETLYPSSYEIYETASDWLPSLRRLPNLVDRPADGYTLSATATESMDLVQAHKLFTRLPFVTTVGYVEEMARVVRPGGVVAFDVVTENCLDEQVTKTWTAENALRYRVMPRTWTVDLLDRRGLDLLGSHFEPFGGALTELLVFRKR